MVGAAVGCAKWLVNVKALLLLSWLCSLAKRGSLDLPCPLSHLRSKQHGRERVYLFKYDLQFVHILSESFSGDLECINVSEQILQSLHGLKGKKRGKCEVGCGWGGRYIKCRSSPVMAMVQEVLLQGAGWNILRGQHMSPRSKVLSPRRSGWDGGNSAFQCIQ